MQLIGIMLVLVGAVILLGRTNMFRFNHPAEAAKMKLELQSVSVARQLQEYCFWAGLKIE